MLSSYPKRQIGAKPGYVYFLHSAIGTVKIGRTRNISQRAYSLTVASPVHLKLLHCISTDHSELLESVIHSLFADKRDAGEWFRVTQEELSPLFRFDRLVFAPVFDDEHEARRTVLQWIKQDAPELERIATPHMPTPNRQPHAPVDWSAYDDLIESPQVAALLGVKPQSLRMYVQRGQLADPAQRTDNRAWYRKTDVQDAILRRQSRRAGVVPAPEQSPLNPPQEDVPPLVPGLPGTGAEMGADAEQAREIVRMTQTLFAQLQREGQQSAALMEEMRKVLDNDRHKDQTIRQLIERNAALEQQLEQARNSPEQKRPWWRRIFGG